MGLPLRTAILATVLFASPVVHARAECAPPPAVADEQRALDTKLSIGRFMELAGLDFGARVQTAKKSILTEHPLADQTVVTLTLIFNYCQFLEKEPSLDGARRAELLAKFYVDVLRPVQGPQAVGGVDRSIKPPAVDDQLGKRDSGALAPRIRLAGPAEAARPVGSPWADIYINAAPLVVTSGNKYFVIVASVRSQADGLRKIEALKAKLPRYDFVLFAPYGGNPNYSVMLASWTSRQRAEEALQAARRDIDRSSFIWACRSEGDGC